MTTTNTTSETHKTHQTHTSEKTSARFPTQRNATRPGEANHAPIDNSEESRFASPHRRVSLQTKHGHRIVQLAALLLKRHRRNVERLPRTDAPPPCRPLRDARAIPANSV